VTRIQYVPLATPVTSIHWNASPDPYVSPQPTLIPIDTTRVERVPQPLAA
jgi:hypothetical protein